MSKVNRLHSSGSFLELGQLPDFIPTWGHTPPPLFLEFYVLKDTSTELGEGLLLVLIEDVGGHGEQGQERQDMENGN